MSDTKPAKDRSVFAQREEQILDVWNKESTFAESLKQREGKDVFTFYDGPPFANGLPHFGHTLVTSIKDSVGRYKTMRGYYVERKNGWDCHGLPVEFAIEKQFGVSGKKQILDLGLDKFNAACRESVFMYKSEWEQFFARAGRWTDTENAYATIDTNYTESVWWTLSQIHKKNLLYRGFKSMPYCPRCETPLSNFEVNEGYRDNVPDPSLFMKFKLIEDQEVANTSEASGMQGAGEQRTEAYTTSDEGAAEPATQQRAEGSRVSVSGAEQAAGSVYLLGWTTTPWSLPGNAAVAVNPQAIYVYAQVGDDVLIMAKELVEKVLKNEESYHIQQEVKGSELVGKSYEPLFDLGEKTSNNDKMYKVWPANFVSVEDGTGVLHVAPAFGEDDLSLGQQEGLDVLTTVDPSGHIDAGTGLEGIEGLFFKDADRPIIKHLTEKGAVFVAQTYSHTYPFCYRCDSPLLYYAISTWFIRVSEIKDQLLKTAEDIEWTPAHIKQGRFGKWLEGARDWAISRNRYWGAPMPIWQNVDDPEDYIVVGSIEELKDLAGADTKLDDLHRPFIDEVTFEKDGKTYKRIEEVLDCWFESGSMPVAQRHYPFENKDDFEKFFPADYIGEGLDQTRLWFYVQHVIATILFDKPAYRHVIVNGMINAADGAKLSKRLKNYPPVEDVFAQEGADTLRLYLLSNYQATANAGYMRFDRGAMKDLNRNIIGTLENSHKFFSMYALIDKWQPKAPGQEPKVSHVLDKWLIARLNETIKTTTEAADDFEIARAINPVFELIEDMSNWYIRRSRRRFWKSEDDTDKLEAYETLWYSLYRLSQLLAPWAPFATDHLWRELVAGTDLPKSVHLSDWPEGGAVDEALIEEMKTTRAVINDVLRQRAQVGIKVRQPLLEVKLGKQHSVSQELIDIIAEEANIKKVTIDSSAADDNVELNTTITDELKLEGVMRDVVRFAQAARKHAGLDVENRILLSLATEDKMLSDAISKFSDTIKQETLAVELSTTESYEHSEEVSLSGAKLTISLQKKS